MSMSLSSSSFFNAEIHYNLLNLNSSIQLIKLYGTKLFSLTNASENEYLLNYCDNCKMIFKINPDNLLMEAYSKISRDFTDAESESYFNWLCYDVENIFFRSEQTIQEIDFLRNQLRNTIDAKNKVLHTLNHLLTEDEKHIYFANYCTECMSITSC